MGQLFALSLALAALAACSGSSSSSSNASSTPSYNISGGIANLSSAGLVLQNNGGDDLTLAAAATSFTFATKVSLGGSYSVSVKTQPSAIRCSVSFASGAAVSSDVSSVGIACGYVVTTYAGTGSAGSTNATSATSASFNYPDGVTVDSSGNLFITDTDNHLIRKITSAGVVTTFAGTGTAGSTNSITATLASFKYPSGIAVDSSSNLYITDTGNHLIRKITSAGVVTTFAGNGSTGSTNASTATLASFNVPEGIAVDSSGNLYIADTGNHLIRKITSAGVVTTFAGSGTAGSTNGTGTAASFKYPRGIAVDSSGNLYVADSDNHLIRKITSAGVVSTYAGTGSAGSTNATSATSASFNAPSGVSVDSSGNLYIADTGNHLIRKITSAGVVTTLAGTAGSAGSVDSTGTAASLNSPIGISVDSSGNLFVADTDNHRIRKLTAS